MNKLVYTESKKCIILSNNSTYELFEYIGEIDVRKKCFEYLKSLENQEHDGMRIEDIFMYDGIPLYIFSRPTFAFWLKGIIACLTILDRAVKKLDNNIFVETDNKIMFKLAKDVFTLECEYIEKKVEKKANTKNLKGLYDLILRYLRGGISYIRFLLGSKNKDNILVFSQAASLSVLKDREGKKKYYDSQYGNVLHRLKENYNILNLQFLHQISLIKKALKFNVSCVPFEIIIILKKLKKEKLINQNYITDNMDFVKKIDYNFQGYDIKDIIIEYILNNLKKSCISFLKEILFHEQIIKKYNIKKCIVIDEGDRGRCFITAGNRLNIDTYAIQHGIIVEGSASYDINSKYNDLIVPRTTFVWGDKYKNILTSRTNVYNDNNVFVSGQIRTDYLFNMKSYLENHSSIDDTKTKILFISQYFDDLVKPAALMLFKALNICKVDYDLIIKIHPSDNVYEDYYRELMRKYNIKNVKILKDEDLYELINWADLIISVHSTVIIEGALLNKPSICIKLPKYNDVCGFVRDGLSRGAVNEYELSKEIYSLVNNIDLDYYENVKKYIEENFYKVDGKVTDRVLKKIIK